MKKSAFNYFLIALTVSFILSLLNSTTFFISLFNEPKNTIYMGTIHYWEDYFFYLNHFFQGAHGAWLTVNRYTTEMTSPSYIYWTNILLGKIGGILGISPIISYNMSILALSFSALLLSFFTLLILIPQSPSVAFYAFLIGNFSTSLINRVHASGGGMTWWPFQIWRTPHFIFDRLGGAAHQQIQTILSYLFFLMYFSNPQSSRTQKVYYWGSILTMALLTTINPIQSTYFIGILIGVKILYKIIHSPHELFTPATWMIISSKRIQIGLLTLTTLIFFFITSQLLNGPPHIQSKLWEAHQHSYTTLPFLLVSIGPVFFLGLVGLLSRIKKLTDFELFGILLILSGYVIFMSKIPQLVGFSNLRILFPASYIFWGLFGAYGIHYIAQILSPKIHLSKNILQSLVLLLFFLITLPSVIWEVSLKIPKKSDFQDPLIFMPEKIVDGFSYLSTRLPYGDIGIANPYTRLDNVLPALSGHTTYSGHMLATVNNEVKQSEVKQLYSLLYGANNAASWLSEKHIKYVIFTSLDGNRNAFESRYSFLRKVYENEDVGVYQNP